MQREMRIVDGNLAVVSAIVEAADVATPVGIVFASAVPKLVGLVMACCFVPLLQPCYRPHMHLYSGDVLVLSEVVVVGTAGMVAAGVEMVENIVDHNLPFPLVPVQAGQLRAYIDKTVLCRQQEDFAAVLDGGMSPANGKIAALQKPAARSGH